MAQDSKNARRQLREGTLRSLNGFAKELDLDPVAIRATNETIAEFFKNLSQKVTAEKLDRFVELCDEWEQAAEASDSPSASEGWGTGRRPIPEYVSLSRVRSGARLALAG